MKVSHLTATELESMSQKLATQEIKIDYSGSVFFDDGKIQKTKALCCYSRKGNTGATAADVVTLQFKYFWFSLSKRWQSDF